MNILIADDNGLSRKYLRILLAEEGHTVVEDENGLAALESLKCSKIDAVISDILMPRMDGYRLCYEIRKNPALNAIPFIAYSATFTSPSDEKVALDIGADRFVRKPAMPEVIIQALHEAVESRAGQAKRFREPDRLEAMKEYSEALVRKLEEKNSELAQANEALNERVVLSEFNAHVNSALTHKGTLREILQLCAKATVKHLDAAFARIWTLNPAGNVLELQASAGMYTHIDGAHGKIPLGQFKIGLIAAERKPHLTNSAIGDPRVHDQDWAKREGMVAFAGYPLLIGDRLVGVMAVFARKAIRPNTLDAMESVAKGIAAGIERKLTEDQLRHSEERFRELAENINEILFISGPDGSPIDYVSPAYERITGASREKLYQNSHAWLENIYLDDRPRMEQVWRNHPQMLDEEYRILRPDGALRWLRSRAFPVKDESGKVLRIVGFAEDITERKRGAEAQAVHHREIQTLYELSLTTLSTLDLHEVLENLLDKALAASAFEIGVVRLLDQKKKYLTVAATRGYVDNKNIEYPSIDLAQHSTSETLQQALSSSVPVITENVPESRGWISFKREGVHSAIRLPIRRAEELLGIIQLGRRNEQKIQAGEISLLEAMASHAAVAIQKAGLYQQTQRNLERIRALHEIDVAIASTLDLRTRLNILLEKIEIFVPIAVASTVRLLNRKTGQLEFIACRNVDESEWKTLFTVATAGRASRVLETKRPVTVRNVQFDPSTYNAAMYRHHGLVSYIGVPLIVQDEVLGVLNLYTKEDHEFSDEEVEFIVTLGGQAAIAVHTAQLFEETRRAKNELETANQELQRSLRQLGSLYTALAPIAAATSPQEMMSGIIDRLIDATDADAALIRVWDGKADRYPIVSQRNFADYYLKAVETAPLGGAVHWVIVHGTPIIVPDIASEPRLKGKVQLELGLRSCAMLPLKIHGEVRGVIHVASRTLGYFDAEQEDHLTAIARQMSISLENRELFFNLKASRDELERSNRVKSEFLSVMSHELRTPLNIIMGYTEMIKQDLAAHGDREGQTALQKIEAQAKALLRLVDMIMAVTRVESGSNNVIREPVDLAKLFQELKANFEIPKDKAIRLIWKPAADLSQLNSDYEKLKQILQNLIDNAIKFTECGTVTITAQRARRQEQSEQPIDPDGKPIGLGSQLFVEFEVADTGVGIPEETLPLIFEMFKQVDSSDTRAFEGVGLGLYIVKKYAELLGGTVRVKTAIEKGSLFTVSLPLDPV